MTPKEKPTAFDSAFQQIKDPRFLLLRNSIYSKLLSWIFSSPKNTIHTSMHLMQEILLTQKSGLPTAIHILKRRKLPILFQGNTWLNVIPVHFAVR